MDKNAIKKYAIWAREELIKRVSTKAEEYEIRANAELVEHMEVIGDRVLTSVEKKQRTALVRIVKEKGFEFAMEEAAYTWFNRFIALRFMEVNGYLPSKVRVFTDDENNFKPQILDEAIHMELDGLDLEKVMSLKEQNETDELYKYLLITQCNALHSVLPKMFPKIGDYTEILFPNRILSEDSVVGRMVQDLAEDDFKEEVEIIGWMYQYYNTEEKEKVINIYKGTIAKEDVAVATQLFTTDWVVRYMVDNSLGRYWIERNPSSTLAEKLQYFVTPKDGNMTYVDEKITPQELTFFEPCMGSGHILVYAFNVLMEIYKESGYSERDAASMILEHNLFGLDIDRRAYQLSYFALKMKARSYDRRFLNRGVEPQVYAPIDDDELENFGSMPIVSDLGEKPQEPEELTLFNHNWTKDLNNWNFRNLLTKKYCVVCTNPPYLNKYNPTLKKFVMDNFKDYSGDLFSVFIYKNFDYCKQDGYSAFMTPFVWMFIKTYEKLREYIIRNKSITSLIQMEYSAFEEATVPICSFVLKNGKENEKGLYFKLSDFKGGMEVQKEKVLEALANKECGYFHETSKANFSKIPGSPIAYWVSEKMLNAFVEGVRLGEIAKPRQGMATTNNNRFLRQWFEVNNCNIGFNLYDIEDTIGDVKWFPYNKGGDFKKWYGNNDYVVNFKNKGQEVCDHIDATSAVNSKGRVINREHYFKECMSWSLISSGSIAFRYKPHGFIFDVAGMSCFGEHNTLIYLLALSNTKIVKGTMSVLAPTINFQAGDIANIPVIVKDNYKELINSIVNGNIAVSKTDWDSFETSWDFEIHPFIKAYRENSKFVENGVLQGRNPNLIQDCYIQWGTDCNLRFETLKRNEEELNRIFIDIYGLQDELTPEVEDRDVTVRLADKTRDVKSFISYAVGCMFGRYSILKDGLIYAGGEWPPVEQAVGIREKYYPNADQDIISWTDIYADFIPDLDNVIPICDDEYFEDDIVGRFVEFVKVVYGAETLEENLDFIAGALSDKGASREVIRKYFLNGFYADHCKVYSKRPIYWQLESGKKNGFKALIYMHRYAPDTMARVRTDYVHEQQGRYRTAITDLERRTQDASTSERVKLTKQLTALKDQEAEIRVFEEKVHHLADQMIRIDLDDGVKHNYEIFKDVLSKIK